MNKKKAIKIVAASAIAASAFAAVAPTQSQAATSVATTVSNAQKAMKAPFDKYYQTGITKKTVSAATVQALITTGTKAYNDATALVKKSGGKSTKTYQAKLDSYKKYLDRSNAYVAGLTSISKVYKNADAALKANTVAELEKAQAELKDAKNQGYVGISKIYGPVVREVLTSTFKRLSEGKLSLVEAALEKLATPTVTGVSAITTKKIEVKFSKAVDGTKAQFAVKKGTSSIGVAATTWSDDKKTATLELNTKISEGTYAVTVSGLTEAPLVGSVTAENEKVGEVKILSDKAVLETGNATATVGYQVLNQYGEDITSSSLANESNLVVSTSAKDAKVDNKGTVTLTSASTFKADDKLSLTIVDKATTKSATTTVTIVGESKVAETAVTGIFNKDNKSLNEDTLTSDFYLLFNATNQYGNAVTNVKALQDDLTFVVSNPAVVDASESDISNAIEVGTDKKVGIKLTPKAKGESTVTIISNTTGKSTSYKVTVGEGTKADTVSISSPEGTIAGGEEVLVPVEVTDNKGTAVTDPKKLTGVTFKATQGSADVDTEAVAKDGKLYVKLTTKDVAANNLGTLVLTASTPTNKIATKVIEVKPNAKPVAITGLSSKVSTSIYKGLSKSLDWANFKFEDQYGRAFTKAEDAASYTVLAEDATPEVGTSAVSIADANNDSSDTDGISVKGENKGSELVTFTLVDVKDLNKKVSSFDAKFTTVEQSEFASYKAKAVGATFYTNDSDYAKDLEVYGVTASGQEVQLPTDDFHVYAGAGLSFDSETGKLSTVADIDSVTPGNQPLVDTSSATTDIPVSKDVAVRVVINNTGDELNLTVPVSAEAPKVSTFEVRLPDADGSLDYGTVASALDLAATNGDFALADLDQNVYVVDQYGVDAKDVTGSTITFADDTTTAVTRLTVSNLVNADKDAQHAPSIADNGSSSTDISGLQVGDTFTAKVTTGTFTSTVNVTVTSTPAE
ncbi:hypothetical protein SAMN05443252_102295 [Bacillus sp. OV322]|uniref:hypothetical protein n=1 Tax=Bacillus sp. OV322 TaxID=1882764 RepID=UPI0008EF6BE8|nr:hypothetical protein [Bacillus sp. OV322]SFC22911.1 hypothetical protein SAMN05443252_102295 [Bacillus sp. OV322]